MQRFLSTLILTFCLVIGMFGVSLAGEITGTLYHSEMANGDGAFLLYSQGKVYHFLTVKGRTRLDGFDCADKYKPFTNGAIWKVIYTPWKEDGLAENITYTGKFDNRIVGVNDMIIANSMTLEQGSFQEAYNDLAETLKATLPLDKYRELYEGHLIEKSNGGLTYSASMIERETPDEVVILVEYIWYNAQDMRYFRYFVADKNGVPVIRKIEKESEKAWKVD